MVHLFVVETADPNFTIFNWPAEDAKEISESLHGSSTLVSVARNLVDEVWEGRPARPVESVTVHGAKYAGQSIDEKLASVREALKSGKNKGVAFVVNMLDEVAWLFNIRGSDIPFNPVFFAYGLVTMNDATLFVDSSKLTDEVYQHLGTSVQVKPYEEIILACQNLGRSLQTVEKVSGLFKCPLIQLNCMGDTRLIFLGYRRQNGIASTG